MAQNKKKVAKENTEIEKSDEVLTIAKKEKPAKLSKEEKRAAKLKAQKAKAKAAKNDKPKRNRAKEVFSELKKVNWPSFGKACAQTGAVLVVVGVFMLAVLGIDSLVAWILSLITKI